MANLKDEQSLEELRTLIRGAFPSVTFTGKVTPNDDAFTPEIGFDEALSRGIDDDLILFNGLQRRRWTELDTSLLESQPDGFVLLTAEAYKVFLAAWLDLALENLDGENEVRNFVIFAFGHTAQQLKALNPEQRRAVRLLLAYLAHREQNDFMRRDAARAIENIDMLERELAHLGDS